MMLVLCFALLSRAGCCGEQWFVPNLYLWLGQGGSWWRMSVLRLQEPSVFFCLSEHQGREVLRVVTGVVCILGGDFLESSAWSVLYSSSEKNNLTKPSVSGPCQICTVLQWCWMGWWADERESNTPLLPYTEKSQCCEYACCYNDALVNKKQTNPMVLLVTVLCQLGRWHLNSVCKNILVLSNEENFSFFLLY